MKKILAYRFSAFGDVAMTVPVFREFLEQNPDSEIVMVSRKNFADLFQNVPRLTFKGVDLDSYKGILGMKRLAEELSEEFRPDLVADFHDVIRTKVLNRVFRFKNYQTFKIDKGKSEKEELTDVWNLDKKQLKLTTERYADVFRAIGFSLELSHQLRPVSAKKSGVGIAPFAQHKGKMLPLEKSFEIARILSETHNVYFLGGGKEEVKVLDSWEIQIPNSTSLAGKLTLKEELQKISELETMISMDSANMHLASLVGTRCISVWGATHYYAGFLGYGQSNEDAVHIKDLTCRPCSVFGDKDCYRGDWACLNEIDLQKIIEMI